MSVNLPSSYYYYFHHLIFLIFSARPVPSYFPVTKNRTIAPNFADCLPNKKNIIFPKQSTGNRSVICDHLILIVIVIVILICLIMDFVVVLLLMIYGFPQI